MKKMYNCMNATKKQGSHLGIALKTLMLLAVFIGGMSSAWAVNWSGNVAGQTISTTTTVNLTGNVTLTGRIYISGGTTTINASGANRTITRGGRNFAMFDVASGAKLVINGGTYKVTINGNSTNYAATQSPDRWGYSAIVVRTGGTATLTDVTIQNNHLFIHTSLDDGVYNTQGGAIFVRGTLTCNNCTFNNCRADQGGAIAVYNKGNATITGGSVIKCTARHRGGGVLVANTDTRCGTSNAVPSGSATLTLSGVTIGGTSANGNAAELAFGGGAYSEFLRANCIVKDNTLISYNKSNFGGHGICVADMGDIELRASDIHHNTPYNTSNSYHGDFGGGGVYIGGTVTDQATAYIYEDCKIHHNSGCRGAGVFMASNMVLNMQGGSIYNNETYTGAQYSAGGGGVFMQGTAEKPNGKFIMSGGSIYSNTATSNPGGGVYLGAGTVTISGGTIRNNTAQGDGGGIYNALGNVTMSGGNIYTNNANGSSNNGGGLYLASGSFTMSGGKIYTNTANNGAGAYLAGGSFTMSGSAEIYSNAAATNGGGIYLANGTPTVKGSAKIYTNTAVNGGGLYLAKGTFKMQGGEVYGNVASNNGGGAYLTNQCVYNMTGGSLGKTGTDEALKNKAKNGGGLYDLGKFTMNGGNILNSHATNGQGGGAFISTTEATSLSNGVVSDNTATSNGGGLYIQGGSAVTVGGVSIYSNTSGGNGGGIYLSNSSGNSFTMTGGAIGTSDHPNIANNGGGAYIRAPFTMTGGNIGYNQAIAGAGGGAYINSTAATTITSATINENTASTNGGGIYLSAGSVTVTDAIFDHNLAATTGSNGMGGGVYAAGSMTIKGTSLFTRNEARLGGAGTINNGTFTLLGGTVGGNAANANKASRYGGGFYVTGNSSSVLLQGGEVSYNEALTATDGAGGGIYVNNSSTQGTQLTQAVELNYNKAHIGGGAYINAGNLTINGTNVQVNNNQAMGDGTEVSTGIFTGDGGGMFVVSGNVIINGTGVINSNYAGHDGGAIYTKNSTSTITIGESGSSNAFTLSQNHADNWGGGIRVGGDITFYTGSLTKNYATYRGGGVFVADGRYIMNGGTVGGTTADGNYTTAEGNAEYGGGGIFVMGGTANINNGSISGNHVGTGTCGGGVYMGQNNSVNPPTSGTCFIAGGTIGGSGQANSATYGGGIYSAGGTITVTQSTKNRTTGNISYNEATDGGGIYTNGNSGVVNVNHGNIEYNTANNGGGIYANRGLVDFSNGNIRYNYASNQGGGIYIHKNADNTYGTLNLKNTAVLDRNYVPTDHKGGGVYLEGVVVIGETGGSQCSVTADNNFAHTLEGSETVLTYTPDNNTRNNIYLPNPEVRADHTSLITVIENAIGTTSHIGFSVPHNHLPVIYCAPSATSMTYLDKFTTGEGHILNTVLFDDTQHYLSVHYPNWPEAFDRDHVYLYGFWPEAVTSQPATGYTVDGNGNVTISTAEGLAWLISTVNGYNGQEANDFNGKTVDLTASVDMSEYGWVSVGFMGNASSTPAPFAGTFNGNGNTITGIDCMVYGSGANGFIDYGLFGFVDGGTVENVFVKDAKFYLDDNANLVLGALVGELNGGTLCNSEASGMLISQTPDAIIGGAVGKMTTGSNGTVHSVISVAEMTGGTMGGLVGVLEAGNLYNSFANPKFNRMASATTQYYGVLAAENYGNIENCYARLQNSPVPSDATFGWFAGLQANGASLKYCYARTDVGSQYFGTNNGTTTGYGYYENDTEAPYMYARRDNQVVITTGANPYEPKYRSGDKQMLFWLNNWVEENGATTYTKWMRTTSKTINDDLPVLKMPFANTIVGTTTTAYLDYGDINTMMAEYQAVNQALCLYQSKDGMDSNEGSGAKLYVNEDVSIIPADREDGVINAYVGITIANRAGANGANPTYGSPDELDWHMFSTPLQQAPLGINYARREGGTDTHDGEQYLFSYGRPMTAGGVEQPYYLFFPESSASHGYFPSCRYGETFPTGNTTLEAGNYYQEWDFYTYYEPEYHWINFKRNDNSHWHENAHEVQIEYYGDGNTFGNEAYLVNGRGYLVAFADSATYLQCNGDLNTGTEFGIPVTTRGYYSTGYNLLGNPYQACLDFNAFAEYNSDEGDDEAIWASIEDANYRILDETQQKYVTYAYGSSANPFGAGRYIHPHQGFMVYNTKSSSAMAYFADNNADTDVQMRAISDQATYRDVQVNYPLVNLFTTESNGNQSMVTVELGRPDKGGAKLMSDLHVSKGQIWCHYDDADWTLAYTQPGVSELPIRFQTLEDNEYTMTWSTHNGEFSYLHLIDNMTGADVDCLSEREYKFASQTGDYASRFRLVFGYTGIEEPEATETTANFAFQMGDEWVVNGEGALQMFDVNGRQLMSTVTTGTQTTLHLPQVSAGVYVLRMATNNGTKVQKIVIR